MKLGKTKTILLMMRLRSRLLQGIRSSTKRIEDFVIRRWTAYNSFIVIYSVIGIPLVFTFSNISTIRYLLLVPFFGLAILSIIEMFKAAERSPYAFIKVERLKYWVSLSFWFLFISQLVLLGLMMLCAKLNVQEEPIMILVNILYWNILVFIGVALYSSLFAGVLYAGRKDLSRTKARASFRVMSNALASRDPREQNKKLFFFRYGIENYNEYLKIRFGFAIRKPQRYYNHVKLSVSWELDHSIGHMRERTENLANLLRTDNDLAVLHSSLRAIVGETTQDHEEIIQDFDFEMGIKKWLSLNKDSISLVITLASLVVAFVSFVTRIT